MRESDYDCDIIHITLHNVNETVEYLGHPGYREALNCGTIMTNLDRVLLCYTTSGIGGGKGAVPMAVTIILAAIIICNAQP